MNNTIHVEKQQAAIHPHSRIDSFFDNFTIGTLLNKSRYTQGTKSFPDDIAQGDILVAIWG